jgi:hypothetical protein
VSASAPTFSGRTPEGPAEIKAAEELRSSLSDQPFDPAMADEARKAVTV